MSRYCRWPLLVALLLCASPRAHAWYYLSEDYAFATHFLRLSIWLEAGEHYFETRNLTPGGDTVMHLALDTGSDASLTEVAQNDDCPGATLMSCLTYSVDQAGFYVIYIYAKYPWAGGVGNKQYDLIWRSPSLGEISLGHYRLGGYALIGTASAQETVETVLVNDGAPATVLLRLDLINDKYRLAAFDFYSGVGFASKLPGSQYESRWVIGTPGESTREGPVRLLRNDRALRDADGDGLGDNLEREMCTCPNDHEVVCGFDCSLAFDHGRDTDGDGLRDDWEAIGIDNPLYPAQLFPLWGASPRHKDIFVEIDYYNTNQRFGQSDAYWVAQRFRALKGQGNPDGTEGVYLHYDVGQNCEAPDAAHDGITEYCGNFGGSDVLTTDTNGCDKGNNLSAIRKGKFHWAKVYEGDGPGTADTPGDQLCWNASDLRPSAPHELGHNLGLEHFGAIAAGVANTKPNYPSLMNYAYEYRLNGDPEKIAFSDGSRGGRPLDPRQLLEVGAFPASMDVSFLTQEPYVYPSQVDILGGTDIDWNRDGDFDYGTHIRAHITPEFGRTDWCSGGCDDQPVFQNWERIPLTPSTDVGPAAAYFNGNTYVFVNEKNSRRIRYTWSSQVTDGWNTGLFWYSLNSPVLDRNCQPDAINFATDADGEKLYVFATNSAGKVVYATISSPGSASSWATLPNPPGVKFTDVSAGTLSFFGLRALVLLARNPTNNDVWYQVMSEFGGWGDWTHARQPGGVPLRSKLTPAGAEGPDGKLYVVTKGVRFDPDAREDMPILWEFSGGNFTRFDDGGVLRQTTIWTDSEVLAGRPTVKFIPHRDASGNALACGNGALWMWYPVPDGTNRSMRYRWSWGAFNATTQDFVGGNLSMGRWQWPGHRTGTQPATGMAVAVHPDGLKAFVLYTTGEAPGITHIPHADGQSTPARLINDHDDGSTTKDGVCRSLNLNSSGKCKPTAAAPSLMASDTGGDPDAPIATHQSICWH